MNRLVPLVLAAAFVFMFVLVLAANLFADAVRDRVCQRHVGGDEEALDHRQRLGAARSLQVARPSRPLLVGAGMERWEAFDLLPDLWRGIDEHPSLVIRCHGNAFLGARCGLDGSVTEATTVGATAVPLRKAAACRRTQYPDAHDGAFRCITTFPPVSRPEEGNTSSYRRTSPS